MSEKVKRAGLLSRVLSLTSEEAARVLPAAAFQFCFVAGVSVLKAATNALVVARFDATLLPALYIAAAVATSLAAAADGTLRNSQDPPRVSMVVCAVVTSVLAVAAYLGLSGAAILLYLFAEGYTTVASVRFWASLGESFDARESKRLFGVIGGFGMAGAIAGGLFASALGGVLGATVVLAFTVASMLACAALGRSLARRTARRGTERTISSVEHRSVASVKRVLYPRGEAVRFLREHPYPRALSLLSALLAVLTVASDYLFRVSANGYDEAALAALFGAIQLAMGVAAMLFQLFLSGRVLARFGIFRYLLIAPFSVAVLGVVCAFRPGLLVAFALKVVESLGSLSINPTGMQLLYGPLPDGVGVPARALIDGLVKKSGAAAGGVVLLLLAPVCTDRALAWIVVGVSVAVLFALGPLKRLYVAAIDARLAGARWGEGIALDAEARGILLKALSDPDPTRALLAADLLSQDRPMEFAPWVRVLLAHPSDRVRLRGVRLALELNLKELVPKLRAIAKSDVRRPRDEAVFALARMDDESPRRLAPLLASPDIGLKGAAVAALVRAELSSGIAGGPAGAILDELLARRDAPAGERRELARLLGRLGGTPYASGLDRLLDDPDVSVRRLAVASAGECSRVALAPRLVRLLADRELRRGARESLASMGDAVIEVLEDALNDRATVVSVRYEIPRLLRYLGTPRAAQVLLFSNIGDDPFLRYRVALALSRLRREQDALFFDPQRVTEAIHRRVDAYLYYLPIYRDLRRALPDGAILLRAMEDRLDQNLESVFRLLGLVYPHKSMMNVFHRFTSGEGRVRAYALELFDNLVDEGMRVRVLPMMERFHRLPSDDGEVERAPARLLELVVSKDLVLRACAITTARRAAPEAQIIRIPEEGAVSENVVAKVFLLEGVDIFSRCSVDDLAALSAIASERRYTMGSLIYRENDPGEALYVIVEGQVRIDKAGKAVLHLRAKESFGETSLLDGDPRPADALALTEVRVLAIDRQDFLDLVSDRPELLKGLFGAVTRHLRLVIEVAAAGRLSAPKGDVEAKGARPDAAPSRGVTR
jgi:ATP/ADP translocase/HEAT repeat protein